MIIMISINLDGVSWIGESTVTKKCVVKSEMTDKTRLLDYCIYTFLLIDLGFCNHGSHLEDLWFQMVMFETSKFRNSGFDTYQIHQDKDPVFGS